MVVDHGDLERAAVLPAEYHPPPVVDPDRMKPLPLPFERLEPIPRRDPKVRELGCLMQVKHLAPRRPQQFRPEPSNDSSGGSLTTRGLPCHFKHGDRLLTGF
jgi:hypothetical protein